MRQPGRVTAQRVGQGTEGAGEPAVRARRGRASAARREGSLDQARNGDDVPLQPLRGVHGEDLHGVRAHLGERGVEPALPVVRGREPGEEPGEAAAPARLGERGRDLDERVEVGARRRGPDAGPRGDLDVEQERPLDLGDEVRQGEPGPRAQVAQDAAEPLEPAPADVGQLLPARALPALRRQLVEGLDQRRLVHGLAQVRPGCAAPAAQQLLRPQVERLEVARPQPHGGAGEQPDQRVAAGGVVQDLERGAQLRHLRHMEQSAEADDLDRQLPRTQRGLDERELGSCPAEHGRGGGVDGGHPAGGPPGPPVPLDDLRDPADLLVERRVPADEHLAGAGAGPPAQRRNADRGRGVDPRGRLPQRLGEAVGGDEHGCVVAPARGEVAGARRRHPGLATVAVLPDDGEVLGEGLEVAGRGAAPTVDGLVRVADGGDAVALPEQRAQQHQLGVARVLVLVEQHDPEPGALAGRDLRRGARQPGRERDLVAEVENAELALALGVPLHQRHQGAQPPDGGDALAHRPLDLARPGVAHGRGQLLDPLQQGVRERGDLAGADEVLGALAGEPEQRLGDGVRRPVGDAEVGVPGLHDLRGELPGRGLAEQLRAGLDAEPQTVVGEDGGRVGVVGRDGHDGLVRERLPRRPEPAPQGTQPAAHPLGELARGLAGEGEAQHLLGPRVPVRDEPHHPGGHRLGLAGPGAGHDEQGLQRRLDDLGLLGRRHRPPEQTRDLGRVERTLDEGQPAGAGAPGRRCPAHRRPAPVACPPAAPSARAPAPGAGGRHRGGRRSRAARRPPAPLTAAPAGPRPGWGRSVGRRTSGSASRSAPRSSRPPCRRRP